MKRELFNTLLAMTNDVRKLSYCHDKKIGRDTATIYHDQNDDCELPEYHAMLDYIMARRTSSPDDDCQHFFIGTIELYFDEDNELHIY